MALSRRSLVQPVGKASPDELRADGSARSWPVIRLDHLWLLVPVAAAFGLAASMPITHSDLFYMMLNGRLMGEQGIFPILADPFTYAPADPVFFNQPWIAQVLFWAAERQAGFPGVIFAHALAIGVAFALLAWLTSRIAPGASVAAGLTLFGLLLAGTNLTVRPQSFALLPFVLTLALLRWPAATGRWSIVAMAALSIAWSNLHGSFALGVVLCGGHLVGAVLDARGLRSQSVRRYAWLTAAAALGSLVNPVGPVIWFYAWRVGADPTNRHNIMEWLPPSLDSLAGQVLFASLPILLILLLLPRRRPQAIDVVPLVTLLAMGLASQRAVIWFGLLVPVAVAHHLGQRYARQVTPRPGQPVLNAVLAALLAGFMALSLPWLRPANPFLPVAMRTYLSADHPTGAVTFLREQALQGRVFTRMEWGGYLAWSLWPRVQVFLDARIEQHPPDVWRDYFAILAATDDWEARLQRYGADYLLLERAAFPDLVAAVEATGRWQRVYADSLSVLYQRAASPARS